MFISSKGALVSDLAAAIAVGGVYAGVKWALFTNNVNPSLNMVPGDFSIADFGGLTNLQAVTWGTVFLNDSGQAEVRGDSLSWLTTSDPLTTTIAYGWVELDTAGTHVIRAEKFAVPYTFTRAGQELTLVPAARRGNN